jgi:hypothetical protein
MIAIVCRAGMQHRHAATSRAFVAAERLSLPGEKRLRGLFYLRGGAVGWGPSSLGKWLHHSGK